MTLMQKIKSRYPEADINELDDESFEVLFENAYEGVVVIKLIEEGRYDVQYPKYIDKGTTKTVFSKNILGEGVFWVLKQVENFGKVMPEF